MNKRLPEFLVAAYLLAAFAAWTYLIAIAWGTKFALHTCLFGWLAGLVWPVWSAAMIWRYFLF